MPQVSVIIPAYNAEPYVAESIESALAQEGVTVEVIVVDDGSTDGTWRVLEGFADRITRMQQANAGPARARNQGAKHARGEWVAFLDADDLWAPDKLAKQLALATPDVGLVYTDRINFGDDGRVSSKQSDAVKQYEEDVFEPLLLGNFITLSSAAMRTSVFHALGGFEEALLGTEDWDLWLRYAADGRVRLCPEPLVRRRWHGASLSTKLTHMRDQRLRALDRAIATPRGRQASGSVRRLARYRCWETSAWFAAREQPWLAFRWYGRAALLRPFAPAPYKGMLKCLLGRG